MTDVSPTPGMPGGHRPDLPTGEVIVSSLPGAPFAQLMRAGTHQLTADEPVDVGGGDAGPNPYDLLLMALGSCTAMTVRLYADRKGWPLEGVVVGLRHERLHGRDCAECDAANTRMERIAVNIVFHGPLDDAQKARLLEIAHKCPVHRTMTGGLQIMTGLAGV